MVRSMAACWLSCGGEEVADGRGDGCALGPLGKKLGGFFAMTLLSLDCWLILLNGFCTRKDPVEESFLQLHIFEQGSFFACEDRGGEVFIDPGKACPGLILKNREMLGSGFGVDDAAWNGLVEKMSIGPKRPVRKLHG